jgi:predicted thioesterase
MKSSLKPGVSRTERVVVDRDRAIAFMGDAVRVYSTPSMVSDVEYASLRLIQEHLDPGMSSVGIQVSVDHVGATPVGESVDVTVTVRAVEGRRVSLGAEIRDALEVVGTGSHTRFVVDVARHGERVAEKIRKLANASPSSP